jgi:hypothetical protein
MEDRIRGWKSARRASPSFHYSVYPISGGNVFGIVPSVPATAPHESEFADLRRELEEIVSKLKTNRDGEAKRPLLREMRRLLAKAERSSS